MNTLLKPASFEDLLTLLRAWRLWLTGAVIGGLLGLALHSLLPPPYRATATVLVDFNVEQSWPGHIPDRELFYFLERESRQLEELAWSDATLQIVANENGLTLANLRDGRLQLSQPADGGWHFYADSPDADAAERLAASWAQAFFEKGTEAVTSQSIFEASVRIEPTQLDSLPVTRSVSRGIYALSGAALGTALLAFWALFKK